MKEKKIRNLKVEEVGALLQSIYDSEIDIAIGWNWDGGFCYVIENNPYPLESVYKNEIQRTSDNIIDCLEWIVTDIVEKYPESIFVNNLMKDGYLKEQQNDQQGSRF